MKPKNVMKSSNVVIAFIFLLLGSVSVELNAQETIKALLKKCENMGSITVSIIREKDKETGEITRDITNVSFKSDSNPALEKEFIAAFQKDEDNADRVTKNISNGKVTNMSFRFGKTTYNYTYNQRTDMVSVNVNEGGLTVTSARIINEREMVDALRVRMDSIRRNNAD